MESKIMRPALCLALAAALVAFSAAASAQTVQLLCVYPSGSGAGLVTVDYGAQTLGVDNVDAAGNVTIMAFHRMSATITDETVTSLWKNGTDYIRFTLNRYSAVLRQETDLGAGYASNYSKPCTPYQRGSRKF
jgi:hypothetical protein